MKRKRMGGGSRKIIRKIRPKKYRKRRVTYGQVVGVY